MTLFTLDNKILTLSLYLLFVGKFSSNFKLVSRFFLSVGVLDGIRAIARFQFKRGWSLGVSFYYWRSSLAFFGRVMLPISQVVPFSGSLWKKREVIGMKETRNLLMEKLGKKLGFKEPADWYKITTKQIRSNGGGRILSHTRESPSLLVQAAFPEHDWDFESFVDHGPSSSNQKHFEGNKMKSSNNSSPSSSSRTVEWLSEKLKIKLLEDWYRVSFDEIKKWIPSSALHMRNLGHFLQEYYPDHPWDLGRLENKTGTIKSSQRKLFVLVKEIFPNSGMCKTNNNFHYFEKKQILTYLSQRVEGIEWEDDI